MTSSVSGLLRDSAHLRHARPRCLRCCPGVTVTTLGRPPHRAREGHGQHLHIRSLVSNPDDRHADHLGLDATLRAVEPPGDDRRVNALMVFKRMRDSPFVAASTWTFSTSTLCVAQDHPVDIPRRPRGATGESVQFRVEISSRCPAGRFAKSGRTSGRTGYLPLAVGRTPHVLRTARSSSDAVPQSMSPRLGMSR